MAFWAPPGSSPGSQPSSLVKSYQRHHSRLSSSDGHVKPVGATPPSGRRSFQGRGRTASALVESPVTDFSDSVVPCVGFDTPRDDSASVEAGFGASSIRAPPGLLSRQLSPQKSGINIHFGRGAQDEPQVVSPSGYVFGDSSGGSAAGCAEALSRAQALYPVFLEPAVTRAYTIAAWAHEGQTRKSGDPVMVHCLETAILVAELGAPADVVAAALLHDVLDDTMLVTEDLERLVPSSVFRLVKAVSRISYISQMHRDSTHGRPLSANALLKLRNMLLGLAQPKAVLIKLADRLHNMRTIHALPFQKQMRIADETLKVFAPLASRLGIWSLKSELEDLCFKALHTEEFYLLREKLHRGQDSKVLQGVLEQISTQLEGTDVEVHDLAGRPKNLYSIFEKTRQKGKSLEEVYDIRAVRIVVGTKQDCYTVLRALERQFETVEGRFKDYIRAPKANGYSSLHCVIRGPDGEPVEVQIRSLHMHFLAEYGLAAHWRYKEQVSGMSEAEQQLVHYYRWVYSWELELLDKKCRPFGSPSRDDSLKRFGSHMACRFPKHRDGCSFETYISRSLPVHPEVADSCPVYVLFSLNDGSPENGLSIRQLPPQCTVGRLLRDAPALLGVQLGPRHALLVNQEEAGDPAQVLSASDHVEVVEQGPFEGALPKPVGSGGLWAGVEAAPASGSPLAAADEASAGQGAELETHVEHLLSSGDLQRQRQRLTKLLDWPQSSEPQRALTGVAS